jgi:hypothetical protein
MPKQSSSSKQLLKKKKTKQKQKQKQIVKTNVKVNVQSSGGSGGGGSTPSFIPQPFRDTSGENTRLVSLVEQIVARVPRQAVAASAPAYNPANDAASVKAVFNAPIDLNVPNEVGGVGKKLKNKRKIKVPINIGSETENDPQIVEDIFNAPINYNIPKELGPSGSSAQQEPVVARRKRRTKADIAEEARLQELEREAGTRELYGQDYFV